MVKPATRNTLIVLAAVIVVGIVIVIASGVAGRTINVLTMQSKGYPQSLIELYERNPETLDFVMGYDERPAASSKIDVSNELSQDRIPLFLQWDKRWGYEKYGDDYLAITGCGPTCLSMVACGLRSDGTYNPAIVASMAQADGLYVEGKGSDWDVMDSLVSLMGIDSERIEVNEESLTRALENGMPIVCSMKPGDFTQDGHFIVLVGLAENGEVLIHDPNSMVRSQSTWSFDKLLPQIDCAWAFWRL